MYISELEMVKAKLAAANKQYTDSDVIKDLIQTHENSKLYKKMLEGEKYFDGEHDILKKDFRTSLVYESDDEYAYENNGELKDKTQTVINENNSNHHNVHNYFAELVEQEADYIAGDPPAVIVEGAGSTETPKESPLKKFEYEITKYTSDELFGKLVADTIVEVRVKGRTFWHIYYDLKGKLRVIQLPAEQIIAIYDTAYEAELREVVRYYKIKSIRFGSERELKRVEWWKADGVAFYTESETGDFVLDRLPDNAPNPAPHWYEATVLEDGAEGLAGKVFGRVPFVEINSGKKRAGLLDRIKGLQDAYNLLSSKLTNDEIDLVSLFWVIQGYGGESAAKIRKKLELNKGVSLDDPDGKIDARQVELNTSERIAYLQTLKKDIYSLGQGLEPDIERSGNVNTTELKMRYARLDKKAKRMARELKVALKSLFEFVVDDLNETLNETFDHTRIKVEFHFDQVVNETDLINNLATLKGMAIVPDTILLQKVPYVDDPNQAFIDLRQQQEAERKSKAESYGTNITRNVGTRLNNQLGGGQDES